jgi:hypothetical protein
VKQLILRTEGKEIIMIKKETYLPVLAGFTGKFKNDHIRRKRYEIQIM